MGYPRLDHGSVGVTMGGWGTGEHTNGSGMHDNAESGNENFNLNMAKPGVGG